MKVRVMARSSQAEIVMTMALMLLAGLLTSAACQQVVVGGKQGWKAGVNYTVWAANQSFHVGDWLLFRFDKYMYDVLEVNETSFEKCDGQNFITNITRGGRDVFQLNETRPYYFICSKGYCFGGMKVAINVTVQELAPPAPSPNKNRGCRSKTKSSLMVGSLLLAIISGWKFVI